MRLLRIAFASILACDANPEPAPAPVPAIVAVPHAALVADAFQDAQKKTAEVEAIQIHQACELYMLRKPDACPTSVADLVSSGMLAAARKDPWGGKYEIVCAPDGRVAVVSGGPDRTPKTDDDIVHRSEP